ncbi:hypothetical protein K435DRAFT_601870, partial [Dendrothele bispora CBS 962.96]
VKPNIYTVVFRFVPITMEVDSRNEIAHIEDTNHLHPGSINSISWIKAPEHRHAKQKVAHALGHFLRREDANEAIKKGLIINGKHVQVDKNEPDPILCVKCWKPYHIAQECNEDHDACGRCENPHRTVNCDRNDDDKFCINCKEKGHGAADRHCPHFIQLKETKKKKNPDFKYKYFVTDDPATW